MDREKLRADLKAVQGEILDLLLSGEQGKILQSEEYRRLNNRRAAIMQQLTDSEVERLFGRSYYIRACLCPHPEIVSPPGTHPAECRCGGLVKNRPLEYEVDEGEYDYRPSPQEWAKIGLYAIVGLILIYIILVGLGVAK